MKPKYIKNPSANTASTHQVGPLTCFASIFGLASSLDAEGAACGAALEAFSELVCFASVSGFLGET